MKTQLENINQNAVNKIQEREQALNGWIVINTAGTATASGHFSGIKVMAGETASITLTFDSTSPCDLNGETSVDLVEGDYLPTPGLTSATITAGKAFLIKAENF